MRRFWVSFMVSSVLIGILFIILLWLIFPFLKNQTGIIASPLPDFLSMTKNNQVSTINLFFPALGNFEIKSDKIPLISARSALTYDLTTNKTLFTKDINRKLPMASLTKVMTAIVALENKKDNDKYLVSKSDLVGEDSMGLSLGEVLSLKELLYGLMLVSANDAAEVLASNYVFGRDAFIEAMNNKAKSLGLKNTNFTNPTGLEGDGNQYTTVSDLLVITTYALSKFPEFAKIVKTVNFDIPYSINHKAFYLVNETNLLSSYSGVAGVKTGYTPEAGLCLITYLNYDGHKIIGILLGSNNRRDDMKELLDYSLKTLGIKPSKHS